MFSPVVKRNIIANYIGKVWSVLMAVAFIPLYIRFMGIEAYGLVGVYTSLVALFSLLDLGLSTTLNRELARYAARKADDGEVRRLVRTLEVVYWGVAFIIAAVVLASAPLLARHWIKTETLSVVSVNRALIIMGLAIAVQWPFSLYAGGLMGLQRQVLLNSITMAGSTLRGAGAVLILWKFAPTIEAFFLWQILVALAQTLCTGHYLWDSLPAGSRPPFHWESLRRVWRFAAGMTGISVLAVILTQTDKIILSKILTLEKFGYYALASTVAGAISYLVAPIFTALFPRFSEMAAHHDENGMRHLYHRSAQLLAVVVLPVSIILALFSRDILSLWTRDPNVSANAWLLLSLLVAGTALNGLMNIPYALQLAHGWTSLVLYMNLCAVVVLAPLTWFMATHYGAVGAAAVWVVLNVGYLVFDVQIMHRRLLPGERAQWYLSDFAFPASAALFAACTLKFLFGAHGPVLLRLGIISTITLSAAAIAAREVRQSIARCWVRLRAPKFVEKVSVRA